MQKDKLETLLPEYPGWHNLIILPVLISLVNARPKVDSTRGLELLFEETLVSISGKSHHEMLRIRKILGELSWSDAEICEAAIASEESGRMGRLGYGSILRVGLADGGGTPQTYRLLELVADTIHPVL